MLMVVIWTSGLDVPRHTTAEPERCGLCLQHRKSDKLGVMGLHLSPSACLHMPVAPAALADLSSPRQDWQVI